MRYHIHERVVVLTVVLVVVSGVLVWSRPANAIGNYNRSAAVAYADQWALSRNSNYPQFGNDCTNFASQVLQAGGYPQTNPGSYFTCDPSLWYQPFFVNMWWYTYSWINAVISSVSLLIRLPNTSRAAVTSCKSLTGEA